MVLMISVLLVDLLTGFVTSYIIHYKIEINPYKFTLIAMFALVFILVPSYRYMSSKLEILVAKILLSGANSFGKTFGLLLSFSLIFFVLFSIYLNQWFHINVLVELKNKFLSI